MKEIRITQGHLIVRPDADFADVPPEIVRRIGDNIRRDLDRMMKQALLGGAPHLQRKDVT